MNSEESTNCERKLLKSLTSRKAQCVAIIKMLLVAAALVALQVTTVGCSQAATAKQTDLPKESYERQPEQSFSSSDLVFKPNQMTSFYDVPGEFGHAMEGANYGFKALSFIITETQPGGGPPLHIHECEEAHVLLEGKASYVIGDHRFTVEAPYVVKIPAGSPHTFVNAGSRPLRLIGVLPESRIMWKELGKNPLVKELDELAPTALCSDQPGAAPQGTINQQDLSAESACHRRVSRAFSAHP